MDTMTKRPAALVSRQPRALQVALPLRAPIKGRDIPEGRKEVVAILARLLLEAARAVIVEEGADDPA
jgi:hypothetical protein